MNENETPQPEPAAEEEPGATFSRYDGLSFILGCILLIMSSVLAYNAGYSAGRRNMMDAPPLATGVGLVLLGIQLLLLMGATGYIWRKESCRSFKDGGMALLFVILLIEPLQLGMFHNGAYCFRGCENRSKMTWAKADLRTLATALEEYAIDWHGFPAALDQLTKVHSIAQNRPYLNQVLRPQFGDAPAPQYATYTPPGAPYSTFWILWTPGPGEDQYQITPGPELRAELKSLAEYQNPSPWLRARIYDPTNGASAGDIIRYRQ